MLWDKHLYDDYGVDHCHACLLQFLMKSSFLLHMRRSLLFYCHGNFFYFKLHNIWLTFMLHRHNVQILAVAFFYYDVFWFFSFFNLLINLQIEFFTVLFNLWRSYCLSWNWSSNKPLIMYLECIRFL